MDKLRDRITNDLQEQLSIPNVIASIVAKKLSAIGLPLNKRALPELVRQIEKYLDSNLPSEAPSSVWTIDLKKEWFDSDSDHAKSDLQSIRVTPQDFDTFMGEFKQHSKQVMLNTPIESGDALLLEWKKQAKKRLSEDRHAASRFNKFLAGKWGKPIDLLHLLIIAHSDVGSAFNKAYHADAAENNDAVFNALIHLHARGCQVGREVVVLLQNGFADGAHARWRTLHELSVIASFIRNQGNDVALRYLDHIEVDIYKEMELHREFAEALHWETIADEDFAQMEKRYEDLRTQYHPNFKDDYGWAKEKYAPNFRAIEKEAGFDHLRPFYKMASENVHASTKGTFQRLSSSTLEGNRLVAGPSIFGLGDPGRNAAFSINLLTGTLLMHKLSYDHLAIIHTGNKLTREIHDAFYEAEANVNQLAKSESH